MGSTANVPVCLADFAISLARCDGDQILDFFDHVAEMLGPDHIASFVGRVSLMNVCISPLTARLFRELLKAHEEMGGEG